MDERQDEVTLILSQALQELETKSARKHSEVDPERLSVLREVYSSLSAILQREDADFTAKLRMVPAYQSGEVRIEADMIDLPKKSASEFVAVLRKCYTLEITALNEDYLSLVATVAGVFKGG